MGRWQIHLGTPELRNCFWRQRVNARKRGIGFHLSLEQWLEIWNASGLLHLRGRHKGQYVMARHGDQGAYEIGNVSIESVSKNCSEGISRAIRDGRVKVANLAINNIGKGKGWTIKKKGNRIYYQVSFRDKYAGIYRTKEEAQAVYRQLVAGI